MTTDELLDIWITNDRAEWSEAAFEVIPGILTERGVDLPEQREPRAEGAVELEEIDDADQEGEPVFYHPDEVFGMARTINWLAPAAAVVTLIAGLPSLVSFYQGGQSLAESQPVAAFFGLVIGLFGAGLWLILQCALIIFALKALSAILRILMELEFNSRGATVREAGAESESGVA